MIDIKLLRENPEFFKKTTKDKGYDDQVIDQVLTVDKKMRTLKLKVDQLRAESNQVADQMAQKRSAALIKKGRQLKEQIKSVEKDLTDTEKKVTKLLWLVPNPALADVPLGRGEADNRQEKIWGSVAKFDFKIKDHLELGKDLAILDFDSGAKISGTQFYFLYNEGALLEIALIQYALNKLKTNGFIPVITPDLAKSRYWLGTGYVPKGKEAQTYLIEGEDLGLIATAEVTLAGRHADEVISYKDLPFKYAGYSHCFRREAGAYGQYSKGLYRVHQFTKAEIFVYCLPSESEKMHQLILSLEEEIYQELGLPYRVVQMCTGDLGMMAARKYDIEVWMPGRNEYGEVTSTSNCTDYQARNLNVRFKSKDGKVGFAHLLNGTAIATSRTIIAILENYQQKDGSVLIPKVLQKYTGFEKITPKVK